MAATISRAFTKRNKRPEISTPVPYREGLVRYSPGTIHRGKISGPVELLSATNPLVYNAPDLASAVSSSSSASSFRSSDESDVAPISPMTPVSAEPDVAMEPNHLSGYFPKRSATITSTPRSSTSSAGADAPSVPKRALSHTKKSHQDLARKRSISRMSPPPSSMATTTTTIRRSQEQTFAPVPEYAEHPFSRELDKVNEVAEDFGALKLLEEEEQILINKGLKKFSLNDYLSEIEELYGGVFDDNVGPLATHAWV
ncbi:conserved hypothetical protein [Talaromyces stipitatus ATCC 10500]|uniref:Uncharacterized protein n=1 Tax=Talaromyces stipitatus (strain ATCC 10500 / CBS 375.48 / QM 6759 / NRRL 1006) TaxID=441959 RepID=B8MFR1_TALSN|nr:uncharacterized protein TSTA_021120 [Talaromyces stipitatus ATCC 10500]EED17051.1 conserved hypothetical protein [Talaromyces stipitatus ATCC 10500]